MKIFNLFIAVLLVVSAVCNGAVSPVNDVEPPLPDFLLMYNDVRSCFNLLFAALGKYETKRKEFEQVENLLEKS